MPRPCALAVLATPYVAGVWRLFLERPGLALEGFSWLAEFALGSARCEELTFAAACDCGNVSFEARECSPCPAPERCPEFAGPPWEPECQEAPLLASVDEPESTPVGWWQLSFGLGNMALADRTTLLPGHTFVVFFEGDAWGHERVLAWPLSASCWLIYAANGDFYGEDTALYDKVVALKSLGERPAGLEAESIVQFDGPIQRGEFLDLMESAQRHVGVLRGQRGLPDWPAPTRWITAEGMLEAVPRPRRLAGRGRLPMPGPPLPLTAAARARSGPGGDLRGDLLGAALSRAEAGGAPAVVWRVAEPGLEIGDIGTEVAPRLLAFAGRVHGVAVTDAGMEVPVIGVDPSMTLEDFRTQRLALFSPPTPRGAPSAAVELDADPVAAFRREAGGREADVAGVGSPLEERQVAAPAASAEEPSADVRVLAVDWDSQGERHKDWKMVCGESVSH
ncbi:unnamed protein product [Prorocentrum cordatum]|uniref:Uncharacterized protein n=1 Tax=Prorocentrum cordatum TaxID=2364126 RepID=A0ABN9UBP9_9DINO|nr:unnamed protein product [Polarella glacialis]